MKNLLLIPLFFIFNLNVIGQIQDSTCICNKQHPIKNMAFIVEDMAVYPGGNEALKKLIQTNIELDSTSIGKVSIFFIINCKGQTCGYSVVNKRGKLPANTEQQLLEAFGKMKIWQPAKQNGNAVDMSFTVLMTVIDGTMSFDNL